MRNVVHCLQFVRLTCAAVCFGVSTMTVLACRTNSSHSETTGSFDAIPRVQETENAAAIIQRGFRAAALKSGRSQSQARVGTNDGVIHKNKKKAPPSGPPILGPLDPDLEDLGLSSREVQSTMAAMTSHRGSVDYEEEQDMTSVDIIMLDEDDQDENIFDTLATSPPQHSVGDDLHDSANKKRQTRDNDDDTQKTGNEEEGEDEKDSKDRLGKFAKIAALCAGVGAACVALFAFMKKCCKCCGNQDDADLENKAE